jgi:hypothetical protein
MLSSSDRVKLWRKTCKQKMITSFGGKCGICGYNKCNDSLQFHHLDPSIKEFSYGSITANPKQWEKIVVEMEKCVMLCANCHIEIHAGIINIPDNIQRLDLTLLPIEQIACHSCPVCGIDTPNWKITCSVECGAKRAQQFNWEDHDLEELVKTLPIVQIAKMIGCSDAAVVKRLKKMNIDYKSNKSPHKLTKISPKDFVKDLEVLTKRQICEKYDINKTSIQHYCSRHNINYQLYNKNKYKKG